MNTISLPSEKWFLQLATNWECEHRHVESRLTPQWVVLLSVRKTWDHQECQKMQCEPHKRSCIAACLWNFLPQTSRLYSNLKWLNGSPLLLHCLFCREDLRHHLAFNEQCLWGVAPASREALEFQLKVEKKQRKVVEKELRDKPIAYGRNADTLVLVMS